jgi:hypothetical protein
MPEAGSITEAGFIDTPRDPRTQALYAYWDGLRGDRAMPSRADIDPTRIPSLLPYIIMYDVAASGGHRVRLVGEEIVGFVGHNTTGGTVGAIMPPRSAEMMMKILEAVITERAPKFRAGKAHWHPDKSYRDFEACFLPLSADGATVNIVLSGISFPL